jgi:hypothetical protein
VFGEIAAVWVLLEANTSDRMMKLRSARHDMTPQYTPRYPLSPRTDISDAIVAMTSIGSAGLAM